MYQEIEKNPFKNAEFTTGIIGSDPVLEDVSRTHIAFVGRSNVGKSSVINAILGRNSLVRSSQRPGKTTEINFFTVDEDYYFVDLPGYGFARMGEKQREKLRKLILWYLMYAEVPRRKTFMVLDAQVGLTDFDREVLTEMVEKNEEIYVIANKIDRLNQKERHQLMVDLEQEISVPVLLVSAAKKKGIKDIHKRITE